MKIVHKYSIEKLRQICINRNYFTNGNNEEYHNFLTIYQDRIIDGIRLEIMVELIFIHSNKSVFLHSTTEDIKLEIANAIVNALITYVVED